MRHPIQEAIKQVRELRLRIVEKQRFKGYSGRARALGGSLALIMSLVMGTHWLPSSNEHILLAWGTVFILAFSLNFGATIYWFLNDPEVERDPRRLKPILEVVPHLVAGAVLTVIFIRSEAYDSLYITWLLLHGLATFSSRHFLPKRIGWVGIFYIAVGVIFLGSSEMVFQQPIMLGAILFIGEWLSGFVLHFDDEPGRSLKSFFGLPSGKPSTEEFEY